MDKQERTIPNLDIGLKMEGQEDKDDIIDPTNEEDVTNAINSEKHYLIKLISFLLSP